MAFFENVTVRALERDFLCVFFGVILGNGSKEWMAYTSERSGHMQQGINLALQNYEAFPIEITVEDDPNWVEYSKLLAAKGGKRQIPEPDE